MTVDEIRYLLAGAFFRMSYTEWGAPDAPVVVCVHGLTRTGRDFDPLARHLSDRFRVICPDLPGRGASDWLPDPALYQPASYVQALAHLLAAIRKPVMWVGTSLGGICGMAVAAASGQPVTRLVLNDIGPRIPAAALARIRDYIGQQPEFADLAAAEAHLRQVHADFGPLTDADWAEMARHSTRSLEDGRLTLHYDPAIAAPLLTTPVADADLSPWWDQVGVPVLAIRGEHSDLLLPDTWDAMARTGASTHLVPGAGHAPSLTDGDTMAVIRQFLEAGA